MKKVKSTLSVLLICVLVIGCFTGCSSGETVSEYSIWEEEMVDVIVSNSDSNTQTGTTSTSSGNSQTGTTSTSSGSSQTGAESVKGSYFPKRNVTGKELIVYWPGNVPDFLKKVTANFEKAYNCKVKYYTGSWNNRATELAQYVNAGKAPDVIVGLVKTDFPLFASSGLLEVIKSNEFDFGNNLVDQTATKNVFTWDGKTYAVGAFDDPEVVIYNKTMIENMGYETPASLHSKGKWTWDAMRTLAKNMSYDKDKDGINDVYGWSSWSMDAMVASNNAYYVKRNGNNVSLNFGASQIKEAYQLIYDMYHTDKSVVPDLYGGLDGMKNGSCVMYVERTQYMFQIMAANKKDEFDFAPIPVGKSANGKNYRLALPSGMALGKGGKNREGGLAYIEMILSFFNDQSKIGPRENSNYVYTDAQKKMISEIKNFPVAPMEATGFGKFNDLLLSINSKIRSGNIPYASAVDSVKSSMEKEIKMALDAF